MDRGGAGGASAILLYEYVGTGPVDQRAYEELLTAIAAYPEMPLESVAADCHREIVQGNGRGDVSIAARLADEYHDAIQWIPGSTLESTSSNRQLTALAIVDSGSEPRQALEQALQFAACNGAEYIDYGDLPLTSSSVYTVTDSDLLTIDRSGLAPDTAWVEMEFTDYSNPTAPVTVYAGNELTISEPQSSISTSTRRTCQPAPSAGSWTSAACVGRSAGRPTASAIV